MKEQNSIITKYAYFFEQEAVLGQRIYDLFSTGVDELWDDAEKAESELKWDQNEGERWFKKMVREKGEPYIAAVGVQNDQVISVQKVQI